MRSELTLDHEEVKKAIQFYLKSHGHTLKAMAMKVTETTPLTKIQVKCSVESPSVENLSIFDEIFGKGTIK